MSKENFGVSELKQKIKNLRCTYNQERMKIKKSQKSGSGSNEVYVPSLKWYYVMDTLLKSITRSTETQDNFEGTIQSKNAISENETEVSTNAHNPQPSSVSINDSQKPTTSTAQNIEDSQSAPIQIAQTLKGKGKGKTSKNKNLQILASAVN
ncbi:unnamed protein product [Parnassius apollo]|uniref:(apollo) hypothetical protein n=1 Tax=Parnassius apollo TaxID=110799 RepID=A0A8S3Y485_PARAO|nr:unnamed protein product [Parnassius apollo]